LTLPTRLKAVIESVLGYSAGMGATEKDKRHFEAIAAGKAESNARRERAEALLSPEERLKAALALSSLMLSLSRQAGPKPRPPSLVALARQRVPHE